MYSGRIPEAASTRCFVVNRILLTLQSVGHRLCAYREVVGGSLSIAHAVEAPHWASTRKGHSVSSTLFKRLELWLVLHTSPRFRRRVRARAELAAQYLAGTGIEIGALHMPLPLPSGAHVKYLDRLPVENQRMLYPELSLLPLVPVDIVDDAEDLGSLPDESQDFLIANHVIEHMQNPIAALERWLQVLRPGGVLFFAVPDKRYTFDKHRPLTSIEHVLHDYREGPDASQEAHFAEIARIVEKTPEEEIARRVSQARTANESPHYHVWTDSTFRELLDYCRAELAFPFLLEEIHPIENEFIVLVRKEASTRGLPSGTAISEAVGQDDLSRLVDD